LNASASPPWLKITLELSGNLRVAAEAALLDAGAIALTLEDAGNDAILEPAPGETPDWGLLRIAGVFRDDVDARTIRANLQERFRVPASLSRVSDEDAPAPVPPMAFGQRLWVTPTPEHALPEQAVAVVLEPGLAFGTGTHPTTALCLEWLDAHAREGMTVVDYGCGSGILGIAAAKLGAKKVICVDHDPQALEATRNNAKRNGCLDRIIVQSPDADTPEPVDLLLANIVARPLLQLGERFASWLKNDGHIVLSGLLPEQSHAVRAFYLRWFDRGDEIERDGWVLLTGTRRTRAN
jgi:ribosomal protein L11 methyltransferase